MADGTIASSPAKRDGEAGGAMIPYWVAWWSPDPRPVISVGEVHLGRNVRKQTAARG